MGAFIDGWHAFQMQFANVAAVTACVLWGGALVLGLLGAARADRSQPRRAPLARCHCMVAARIGAGGPISPDCAVARRR